MAKIYKHLTTQERAVVMTMRADLCCSFSLARHSGFFLSALSTRGRYPVRQQPPFDQLDTGWRVDCACHVKPAPSGKIAPIVNVYMR